MTTAEIDPRNAERDAAILDGARRLIHTEGLGRMTRARLADYAGVSATSICNFGRSSLSTASFPSDGYRSRLLKALMADAVEQRDVKLVAAGLVDGCLLPADLTDELRVMMGV